MNWRTAQRWLMWSALLLSTARAEQVVISEIMVRPSGRQPQFIEVVNNTVTVFDIANWRLTGGVKFDFPDFSTNNPGLTFLKPFERILLCGTNEVTLRAACHLTNSVRIFGPWSGKLSRQGERLTLEDKNGVTVCTVKYGAGRHWPAAAGAGHSLELRDPNHAADDWRNWTASAHSGGTPGDAPAPDPAHTAERSRRLPALLSARPDGPRLNELHFQHGRVDWIEVFNPLDTPFPTENLFLSARADFSDRIALSNAIPARGCAGWNVSFPLNNDEVTVFLVDASNTVLDGRVFAPPPLGECWQAFPDGTGEWYAADKASRNATNHPPRHTDIVINEIMFDPPSVLSNATQWIELFNRGPQPADLSGWRLEEAVTFKFPKGTTVPAGGFLVVAADTNRLRAVCGNIPLAGNFKGKLSHKGELLRLVDRSGNLVNEVDSHSGGDWPELAAGLGSSLELIHPWMDNRLASAWLDSDETGKSAWREYSCEGKYEELHTKGVPSDYKEIHFHLVGDGHLALKEIWFGKKSSATNYILNGTRLSDDGLSAKGWLCQGTHAASFVTNGELHIVADGHGDNRPNRVEIDVVGMNRGETCELKFKARWLSGKPRLIAQTWDHSIAASFLLEVPPNLGTPGAANSCRSAGVLARSGVAVRQTPEGSPPPVRDRAAAAEDGRAPFAPDSAPPQVDGLLHNPAVPRSTNTVKVTARVWSASPLASVEVFHRLDNDNASGVWTNAVMHDDGQGGDTLAGDGFYTAELPRRGSGQIVQFYVQATATNGLSCRLPRQGAARPAMYIVDNRKVPRDLRTARFIVSAYDLGAMGGGNSPKYGFKYPLHSNRHFNSTFISNEEDVFYNGGLRHSGSPFTRGGWPDRPKFTLPADRRFRAHDHFYFDNDAGGGNFHNRVTRYWLYLLGHPVGENEVVRVIINTSGADLREDTEPVANDFLNRNFPRGSKGQLCRVDDEWWFMDNWDRDSRDADWNYKGSDNPGRYRTEWMKRSNEVEDDFTDLIALFKAVSARQFDTLDQMLDVDAVLKHTVVRGYIADWDTFTMSRGKNAFFYQRATDGRFQFLLWDSDLAFGDANSGFYGGRIQGWIERPQMRRLFHYWLAELHEKFTKNSARFNAWLQADEDASPAFSNNPGNYRNWCNAREAAVLRELGKDYTAEFKVLPVNASNTVTNATITLTGTAPCTVYEVSLDQHPKAKAQWKDTTTWKFADLPLAVGENVFTVRGTDKSGLLLRHASVTVTRTNASGAP